jgi:hypothetical protein
MMIFTSSTKYKDGYSGFFIIAVYWTRLETAVEPILKNPGTLLLLEDGRQYEKVLPKDEAACEGKERWPRPRPSSPSTSPKSPRLVVPHPNTKPGRAREEVKASVSWERAPDV